MKYKILTIFSAVIVFYIVSLIFHDIFGVDIFYKPALITYGLYYGVPLSALAVYLFYRFDRNLAIVSIKYALGGILLNLIPLIIRGFSDINALIVIASIFASFDVYLIALSVSLFIVKKKENTKHIFWLIIVAPILAFLISFSLVYTPFLYLFYDVANLFKEYGLAFLFFVGFPFTILITLVNSFILAYLVYLKMKKGFVRLS